MRYTANIGDNIAFNNKATHCVGTGRMDLALHKEYLDELKMVQDEIGFSYIRGHGLFCKDMAIYRQNFMTKEIDYCFTYLDRVMDSYMELNIRPILELGFMPEALASSTETTFYWKGNITPPKDYEEWAKLLQATLKHLIERYGEEEVLTWPIEVWNEPNLTSFWKDSDMEEYFKLYKVSVTAIKEVNSKFKVGGPAICGVDDERWLRAFLEFVKDGGLALDFVSRHHYTSYTPKWDGHYGYIDLHEPDDAFGWLERSRDIVDSFDGFKNLEIFVTEFNTSYVPNAPIHDTNLNAAYVAHMLSRLGDKHESYSYWTFGDVFEEMGVAYTPFSGGFGLVANGLIRKPTYWTFAFYKKLEGRCIMKNDDGLVVVTKDGDIRGLFWNVDKYNENKSVNFSLAVDGVDKGEYFTIEKYVNEEVGNPLKVWHEMGEPAGPTKEQNDFLRSIDRPAVKTSNIFSDGILEIDMQLEPNEIRYIEVKKIKRQSDTGYDYDRVMNQVVVETRDE